MLALIMVMSNEVYSQLLAVDSVEYIRMDRFGYNKIVCYSDSSFLSYSYSNHTGRVSRYSFGKYEYDKHSRKMTFRTIPNSQWNISFDSLSFSSGFLSIYVYWPILDSSRYLFVVNTDSVIVAYQDSQNMVLSDTVRITNDFPYLEKTMIRKLDFVQLYNQPNHISVIECESGLQLIEYYGFADNLHVKLMRIPIVPPELFESYEKNQFFVDDLGNLTDEKGNILLYYYAEIDRSIMPVRKILDDIVDPTIGSYPIISIGTSNNKDIGN